MIPDCEHRINEIRVSLENYGGAQKVCELQEEIRSEIRKLRSEARMLKKEIQTMQDIETLYRQPQHMEPEKFESKSVEKGVKWNSQISRKEKSFTGN